MELVVGEYITVTLSDAREFTGLVLPNNTLKLDDGYNIGIDPENVSNINKLEQQPRNPVVPEITRDDSKPRVDILHTGGTIASKVDYATGGVHNHIKPDELLGMYPELQDKAAVYATFVANMSSDDMRFAHYNMLIDAVHEALKNDPKGIIITHGTDTLHYTSAALHYALRGIDVPVLLVGSQRSSDRGSSDAALNLQAAVKYCVSKKALPGVYVAMHETSNDTSIAILHGAHARKMHSSKRDAFKAINSSPVARVTDSVEILRQQEKSSAEFCASHYNTDLRIGMLYAHPNMSAQELSIYNDFDGLVVLGSGLGHLPITAYDEHTQEHAQIFEVLDALQIPVVMSTQCINGRVNLQVYSPGRKLQEAGILGHDLALTPETLFIKLAYILSTEQKAHAIGADMDDIITRTVEESYE
jgi:glutamyl-tRNA(Gln) amidotransferase subunit D